MHKKSRTPGAILIGALFMTLAAASAPAQSSQYGPESSDIRQTVARVSYLSGPVSYARGDSPDDWQPPDLNVPLTLGDRVYTGRGGRLELQIHGGTTIRLDADTDLAALNLTEDTKQFSQTLGVAAFQVRRLGSEEVVEFDTPNAAVTVDAPGDYRIDVDGDGNTRVSVRTGRVIVASGGGQVTLQTGDEMDIQGIDRPQYDVYAISGVDPFDRWVASRESRSRSSRSRGYVSEEIVGVADLDDSGHWDDIPEYGRAWCPNAIAADWAPYRVGHWVWQDPWGWTWISAEPWGWAPYHYGRWVTHSSRWYWVPVGHAVRTVYYAPALVAFVGGGPGFSASVGWFPLAPRDPFIPWWGARRAAAATSVAYVNRSYVTVVNQTTFVSGGLVSRGWVRDQAVVRQAISAPVLRGPLPFVPTQGALRVAVRTNLPAAPRPPAIVLSRPVVARVAPPPRPPAFSAKIDVIRQNRGAPVDAATAGRIVEQRGRPEPSAAIRPAATGGPVTLSQGARRQGRNAPASAPAAVQPIAPGRGRPLATVERPVLAPAPAAAPAAGNAPAPSGNSRGNPGGESWRNRQQPSAQTQRQPQPQPQPQAGQPVPAAPVEQAPQDHRRRPIERQPAAAPTAVAPAPGTQPRGRPVAPAPTASGAPPKNGPPPQELRRQTNRGRQSLEQTPPPQPTAAPAKPAVQSERGRRAVPPGQAQPQAAQPQPAPQQPERPAPEARGRGNAEKPPPPPKKTEKPQPQKKNEKKEEKKPD